MSINNNKDLELVAAKARFHIVDMVHRAKSGHPGGSLSCIDALTALYFREMKIDPACPSDPDRDRFVLSKGHCTPALYSILSLRGFFPEEDLKLFRSVQGHYSGHPDMNSVKGVDMSTGSLGQGLSCAVGMALAAKLSGKSYRTYVICGDGEIEEGQIWEAMMAGAKWHLNNLCVFIDKNGLQIDGRTCDVMPTDPLDKKMEAFNWNVLTIDGHDFDAILSALAQAKECIDRPTAIILNTVKGKGVSFMENNAGWHGKAPDDAQYETAVTELNAKIAELEAE